MKVEIIWFSPECILRTNFKRTNICWKCPSLFSFWITTSQGIFSGELFGLFLLLVNYMPWPEHFFFLPKGVILITFLTKIECSDFSCNAVPCVVWILPRTSSSRSGFKEENFFAVYALGIIMFVQFSLLILSHNYESIQDLFIIFINDSLDLS